MLGALIMTFGIASAVFTPTTASAEESAARSLAGSWTVSVIEYLSTGPVTRSAQFTFNEGGDGSVVTGGGLTGTLTWTQQKHVISIDANHDLPPDGTAKGFQVGTLADANRFTSSGTTTLFRADGSVIVSFRSDFTGTRNR
ncbi:hypothetical protein ACWF82_29975 [Nocardia sp. NPDC055053]